MSETRPTTIVFAIPSPLGRGDITPLCMRLYMMLQTTRAEVALCDVRTLAPDMVSIDALARFQVTALRLGKRVLLRSATTDLCGLVALTGLMEALPLELERQPEQREQPRGVEKERELADPAA